MFSRKKTADVPLEIDVFTLKALMDSQSDDWVILDCRELHERELAAIEPSLIIPMRETQQRLTELEEHRDKNIVVYCHGGVRSLRVAQFLRQEGFAKSQNLAGGIDAWSTLIDPSVPRY